LPSDSAIPHILLSVFINSLVSRLLFSKGDMMRTGKNRAFYKLVMGYFDQEKLLPNG